MKHNLLENTVFTSAPQKREGNRTIIMITITCSTVGCEVTDTYNVGKHGMHPDMHANHFQNNKMWRIGKGMRVATCPNCMANRRLKTSLVSDAAPAANVVELQAKSKRRVLTLSSADALMEKLATASADIGQRLEDLQRISFQIEKDPLPKEIRAFLDGKVEEVATMTADMRKRMDAMLGEFEASGMAAVAALERTLTARYTEALRSELLDQMSELAISQNDIQEMQNELAALQPAWRKHA